MAKILMLVSSAKVTWLADGTPHITGYFVEEAIKPYDRFIAAGAEVVVATADGQTPHPDPYGLAQMLASQPELPRPEHETRESALRARSSLLAEIGLGAD